MLALPQLQLLRRITGDDGTFGDLPLPTGKLIHTAELPWRDLNRDGIGDPKRSCVTPGIYRCEGKEHPHHGWCYELQGVQGRSAILLHPANFAGDITRGFESELLGCIAPGLSIGMLTNYFNAPQRAVLGSRQALALLESAMGRKPFELHIVCINPGTRP